MKTSKTKWIAETAIFIALLVVLQYVTKAMGQFVTGSCVNLVLILSTALAGLWSGVAVAAISPFFAFMFGIGPALFQIVPAVALGNVILVLAWHFVPKLFKKEDSIAYNLVTAIVAAVVKFLTLYLVIVKLLIPTVLKLPDPQASVMSATFSTPQLITALIGGIIAVIIVPALKKAVNKSK